MQKFINKKNLSCLNSIKDKSGNLAITQKEIGDQHSTYVEIQNENWSEIHIISREENLDRSPYRIKSIDKHGLQGIAITDTDQLEAIHHRDINRVHSAQIGDHEAKTSEKRGINRNILSMKSIIEKMHKVGTSLGRNDKSHDDS